MLAQAPANVEGIDPELDNAVDGNATWGSEKIAASDDLEVQPRTKQVDVPPDGGYGWVCVVRTFLRA
jgi:hypothetical protein